ncbi:MAG TPA: ABC transporter ATP-binding protein [Anaerolineae bacterium]|nr:ABC transporter ATP-binding protein [Anaerolineae bacterium]
MTHAISVHNLTKTFGDFTAVNNVTFDIPHGQIIGYLGPNGSGKTTTIRMLLGLLTPTAGSGQILGHDITHQAEQIRPHVGYMSQKFALYDELTTQENLNFYAGVYSTPQPQQRINHLLDQLSLTPYRHHYVHELATGWRQRLALGVALTHNPQLIFLDEPTGGVDPQARRNFWDIIYDLANNGTTIFVTTHYMDEAEYCDRLGIMYRGQLLALDTPANLKQDHFHHDLWQITTPHYATIHTTLDTAPHVHRVTMAGNRLRVTTTKNEHTPTTLGRIITHHHPITPPTITPVQPTLEDIFITLASE